MSTPIPAGVAPFVGHIAVGLVELSFLFVMISLGANWSSVSVNGYSEGFGLWSFTAVDPRTGASTTTTFTACDNSAQAQAYNICGNIGGARTFCVFCFLALLFAAFSVPLYVFQAKLGMVVNAIPAGAAKVKEMLIRKMLHVILLGVGSAFALISFACWTGVQSGVNNVIVSAGSPIAFGFSAGFGLMVTVFLFLAIAAGLLWIAPIPGAPDGPAAQPNNNKPPAGNNTAQPTSGQPQPATKA